MCNTDKTQNYSVLNSVNYFTIRMTKLFTEAKCLEVQTEQFTTFNIDLIGKSNNNLDSCWNSWICL